MKLYSYNGPVMEFDRIVANHWNATTRAETEKKARSNLAHQFKMETGRACNSKITVLGKLIIESEA